MASVRSIKNQYLGINAHLHSLWQATGRWNRFHNVHIAQLMMLLKAQLLPIGYTAEIEESLQIRRLGDEPKRPKAGILIRDLNPYRSSPSPIPVVGAETMVMEELIVEEEGKEHPYSAVAIYERDADEEAGEPIAWVELLSPSNKGLSKDAVLYQTKREALLRGGMVFVELDYLSETSPTFERLPDYTQQHPGATAYRLLVLDPRPELRRGLAYLYFLGVDASVPPVTIPLSAGDKIVFDFGAAYRKTFEEGLYGYDLDYRQLPLNFERYSPADQTRIACRMVAILKAAQAGIDLDANAPLPVEALPLEEALAQIKTLSQP
jgi:hypothetical protein